MREERKGAIGQRCLSDSDSERRERGKQLSSSVRGLAGNKARRIRETTLCHRSGLVGHICCKWGSAHDLCACECVSSQP